MPIHEHAACQMRWQPGVVGMTDGPIRLGIVGYGGMGPRQLAGRAEQARSGAGAVDLVAACTTDSGSHHLVVSEVLDLRLHTLCEKPLELVRRLRGGQPVVLSLGPCDRRRRHRPRTWGSLSIEHSFSAGDQPSRFWRSRAQPFMQNRIPPASRGPSGKTWPRWPSQRAHRTSVRTMP